MQAGTGFGTFAQIGHGGFVTQSDASGSIDIRSGFIGIGMGENEGAYGQIGHGGTTGQYSQANMAVDTDVNLAGDININADMVELYAGSATASHAQIGHGDVGGTSGGTRSGDINMVATSEISVADDVSKAWIGHFTSQSNGISGADISLEAAAFDQTINIPFIADVVSGGNSLFSTEIIDNAMQGGDVTIKTNDSNLSIDGVSSFSSNNDLTLHAENNDILLNSGDRITNAGSGNIILAAGENFHNNSGSIAPLSTNSGRFLVYSTDWDLNTKGDMVGGNLYDRSYAANPPASITQTGDQFIYVRQPILTITGTDTTVTYNGTTQTQTGYTIAGLVNGDSLSDAMDNDPTLTGYENAGTYNSGLVAHDGLSSIGYGFNIDHGNLTIEKKAINANLVANDKIYDGTTVATGTFTDDSFAGDTLTYTPNSMNFADKNVGANIAVTAAGVVVSGADAGNYDVTINTASQADITKANLDVTANDDAKTFNGTAYTGGAGVSFNGFVAGEDATQFSGTVNYTGDSQGAIDVGLYDITPDGLTALNYNLNYINGQLTIQNVFPDDVGGEEYTPREPLKINCLKDIFLCEDIDIDPIQLSSNRAPKK